MNDSIPRLWKAQKHVVVEGFRTLGITENDDLRAFQPLLKPMNLAYWRNAEETDLIPLDWMSVWISPAAQVIVLDPGSYHGQSVSVAPTAFDVDPGEAERAQEQDNMEWLESEAIKHEWISIDIGLAGDPVVTAEFSSIHEAAMGMIYEFITDYLPNPRSYKYAFNAVNPWAEARGSIQDASKYHRALDRANKENFLRSDSPAAYNLLSFEEALHWLEKGPDSGVSITRQFHLVGADAKVPHISPEYLGQLLFNEGNRWDASVVESIRLDLRAGKEVDPIEVYFDQHHDKIYIMDGHHRALAAQLEKKPLPYFETDPETAAGIDFMTWTDKPTIEVDGEEKGPRMLPFQYIEGDKLVINRRELDILFDAFSADIIQVDVVNEVTPLHTGILTVKYALRPGHHITPMIQQAFLNVIYDLPGHVGFVKAENVDNVLAIRIYYTFVIEVK